MLVNAVAVSDGMQATSWTVSCDINTLGCGLFFFFLNIHGNFLKTFFSFLESHSMNCKVTVMCS